MPRRVHVVMQH